MTTLKDASNKAVELGATPYDHGINWGWSYGFPTRAAAEAFIAYLNEQGFEHRGIYRGSAPGTFDIRYRNF